MARRPGTAKKPKGRKAGAEAKTPRTARFETTCPHCQTDFDVDDTAAQAECPACNAPIRLVDEGVPVPLPGERDPTVPGPGRQAPSSAVPLTRSARVALTNALLAPVASTLIVYAGFPALLLAGPGALAFVASLPIGIAIASAIIAARTGLRGSGWALPVAVVLVGCFLFWQDGLIGLIAGIYLPVGATIGVVLLGSWVAVSAGRRALARDVPAIQVGGLTVTFAIAVVAAFVLVFLKALTAGG